MNDRPADWQPLARKSFDDRIEEYQRLRSECPVPFTDQGTERPRFWSLLRYKDIHDAARDPGTFSNGMNRRLQSQRLPLESDPPLHTQIRKLLVPFFSGKAIQALEVPIRTTVQELVGPLVAAGRGDAEIDIARPLTPQVLLLLLGQPRTDWPKIKAMSNETRARARTTESQQNEFARGDAGLWAYAEAMVADREQKPRPADTDITSALLAAQLDGQSVARDQITGIIRLLIAAGHHSTSRGLGICMHYLAQHADLQAELRRHPDRIRAAIEEILRLESPVVAMPRKLTRDVALHGREMAAGDVVMLNWASANRDKETFPDADRFDADRKSNINMVFGTGIHLCIGAALARSEIRITLEELLARTDSFTLSGPSENEDIDHHGYAAIPLTLAARTMTAS